MKNNQRFDDALQMKSDIEELLRAVIQEDHFFFILDQEGESRILNAIGRAQKGESGALRYLHNCFPDAELKSGRQTWQQQRSAQGSHKESDPDAFPADQGPPPVPYFPPEHEDPEESGYSNAAPPRGPASLQAMSNEQDEYIQHHVYGSKGAFCFEASFFEKHGLNTVAIDAANTSGKREYDWSRKIRFMLTQSELPIVLAVFLGMSPFCKLSNHGQENNKTFELTDQGSTLFAKMYGKDQIVQVQIQPADAFYVAQILIRQMLQNAPWMDSTGLLNAVKMIVANRVNQSQQQPNSARNLQQPSYQRGQR